MYSDISEMNLLEHAQDAIEIPPQAGQIDNCEHVSWPEILHNILDDQDALCRRQYAVAAELLQNMRVIRLLV